MTDETIVAVYDFADRRPSPFVIWRLLVCRQA